MDSVTTGSEQNQQKKTQYLITRRFHAHIRGSMDKFSKGGVEAASLTPINGKSGEVFGIADVFDSNGDAGMSSSALQNAVLHRITVLETKNDFPVALGVNISSIPSEESIKSGQKYCMTCMGQTHNPTPCVVFEADINSSEGIEFRSTYPEYNATNLETHGVLPVNGTQYHFVSHNHPVIEVLRHNQQILNGNIDDYPKIDGEWYKISKPVFQTCCKALRSKILSKVSTRDLNNFSIQISRLNNSGWCSQKLDEEIASTMPQDVFLNGKEEVLNNYNTLITKRPYTFSARIEVTYEVHA